MLTYVEAGTILGGIRARSFARWGEPKTYDCVESLSRNFTASDEVFSVSGPLPIDGLFRRGEGNTLLVFFNAALERNFKGTLPYFTWVNSSKTCHSSCLFLSDPTLVLSENLYLAWYVGTETFNAQSAIADVIKAVMARCGATRAAFVGSSGGAFPALLYSSLFPNSAAYVNAPATTIIEHHSKRAIDQFSKVACPQHGLKGMSAVLDLRSVKLRYNNPLIITQNTTDTVYITSHLKPFLAHLGIQWSGQIILNENLLVIPGEWGQGHKTPPSKFIELILSRIDTCPGDDFTALDLGKIREPHTLTAQLSSANKPVITCHASEPSTFAFYLMRDGERLDTQWYSERASYVMPDGLPPGRYFVRCFAKRNLDGFVVVHSTSEFFYR